MLEILTSRYDKAENIFGSMIRFEDNSYLMVSAFAKTIDGRLDYSTSGVKSGENPFIGNFRRAELVKDGHILGSLGYEMDNKTHSYWNGQDMPKLVQRLREVKEHMDKKKAEYLALRIKNEDWVDNHFMPWYMLSWNFPNELTSVHEK